MSLENHLKEALSEVEVDRGTLDGDASVCAREVRLLLEEPALRSEVYEKASLDPIVGDDLNMASIHAVLDALNGVLK